MVKPANVILGVIGADCHAVGNRILEAAFSEAGFNVINLGVMASQDDFVSAAAESGARAILVSSLYGHGEIDCAGLREKCDQKGLKDILLYVGGNLVVGKTPWERIEKKFKAMGYDRVFGPKTDVNEAAGLLKKDLHLD